MDTLKNILIDGFNGMSLNSIPFFIFQLLVAAFLGWIIQLLVRKKTQHPDIKNGPIIAFGICLVTTLVKYMLPFAVLGAAAILLLMKKDKNPPVYLFLIAVIGVGCGIGSVIPTAIGTILLGLILLFVPMENQSE